MSTEQQRWAEYLENELPKVTALLTEHNIAIDDHQPHIKGERFLIQSLTTIGGRKMILIGTDGTTGKKVVIKAASDYDGKQELSHERMCRTLLHDMSFSYESFHSPKELLFTETKQYTLYVGEFIEQASSFLERPLEEQFDFALRALKAQEQTRATTATHLNEIQRVFGTRNSQDYLLMMQGFIHTTKEKGGSAGITSLLEKTAKTLETNKDRIDQYSNFLTHIDFVPHNFRIRDNTLYLLDFSSLRFGNKHESWARFLNFMTLYNRELEQLLITYVEQNRSFEERESLQLLRTFRLSELITYYTNTLSRSEGNLRELNEARITFWSDVLAAEQNNERVATSIVEAYKAKRDSLRSSDEKMRQEGLH
ncbi:MAG: hypothetical protein RL538_322 [Candidatus Parcubacteria bacterium]|jgi:thiamine kinase-like enzyme